ncbi:MAG: copper resistance protein CopC [Candidatus Rokubacteria bacterium]|nr:copper resistance protein CopC [Candidatus Rokubacteria bacterium]
MSRLLAAVAAAAILAAGPAAFAHSLLLEASPPADAEIVAPRAVSLRFNNRVEKRLSKLRLVDPEKRAILLPVALVGAADRLEAPVTSPLAPGPYRLEWRVLSTDGHVVTGTYGFRVAR